MLALTNNDLYTVVSRWPPHCRPVQFASQREFNSLLAALAVLDDDVDQLDRLLQLPDADVDLNYRPTFNQHWYRAVRWRPTTVQFVRLCCSLARIEPPQTPLLYACTLNRAACLERLLDEPRVSVRADDALLFAVVAQSVQAVDLLLRRHDRIVVEMRSGAALLLKTAAQFGFDDVLARLLDDRRFDARELARDDWTLYRWCENGHIPTVRLLLLRVRLVELAMTLRGLKLPVYVVLEIVDWLPLMAAVLGRQEKIATLQRILERKESAKESAVVAADDDDDNDKGNKKKSKVTKE